MKVRFLDAARSDLREAVRYYESRQPGLGRSFRDEFKVAIDRITSFPEACQTSARTSAGAGRTGFPTA